MIRHLLCSSMIVLALSGASQGTSYRAWLWRVDSAVAHSVDISTVGDSGIWLHAPPTTLAAASDAYVPDLSIDLLQFRRKGAAGTWTAILGATGTLMGTVLSMNSWGIPQPTLLLGTGLGVGLGAMIGSAKVSLDIGGSRKRYQQLRRSIKAYVDP